MDNFNSQDELHEYWRQQVVAWQDSGLSGAKFCDANQLIYHRFVYWRQKYTAAGGSREVRVSHGGFTAVNYLPDNDTGLTLSLPNGLIIRGIAMSNVAVVRQLLDTL